MVCGLLGHVHRFGARKAYELSRLEPDQVVGRAGPDPEKGCASSVRSINTRSTPGSGKGATPPGANPLRSRLRRDAQRAPSGTGRAADLLDIAAPVTGNERHDGVAVAEHHERLDDLRQLAPGGLGRLGSGRGTRSNFSSRASPPAARRNAATRSTDSGHSATIAQGYSRPPAVCRRSTASQ